MTSVEYKFNALFDNSGHYTNICKLFVRLVPMATQSEYSRGTDYGEKQSTLVNCSIFRKGFSIF
jgi:hypothetical protein